MGLRHPAQPAIRGADAGPARAGLRQRHRGLPDRRHQRHHGARDGGNGARARAPSARRHDHRGHDHAARGPFAGGSLRHLRAGRAARAVAGQGPGGVVPRPPARRGTRRRADPAGPRVARRSRGARRRPRGRGVPAPGRHRHRTSRIRAVGRLRHVARRRARVGLPPHLPPCHPRRPARGTRARSDAVHRRRGHRDLERRLQGHRGLLARVRRRRVEDRLDGPHAAAPAPRHRCADRRGRFLRPCRGRRAAGPAGRGRVPVRRLRV